MTGRKITEWKLKLQKSIETTTSISNQKKILDFPPVLLVRSLEKCPQQINSFSDNWQTATLKQHYSWTENWLYTWRRQQKGQKLENCCLQNAHRYSIEWSLIKQLHRLHDEVVYWPLAEETAHSAYCSPKSDPPHLLECHCCIDLWGFLWTDSLQLTHQTR